MSRTTPILKGGLATVWTIVESLGAGSTLIVVASATNVESTSPVARGLCDASSDAGSRTAYLYVGPGTAPPSESGMNYDELLLPAADPSRRAFDGLLPAWRSQYDVLIVDIPQLNEAALGAHIARIADGVVIALFPGRRIVDADRDLKTLLSQLNTPIVGIVNTTRREVADQSTSAPSSSMHRWATPVRQQ